MEVCMHRPHAMGGSRLLRRYVAGCIFVVCLGLSACASITLNTVQDGRLVVAGPIAGVEVFRQGVRQPPQPGMALQAGDEIWTGPQSTVVLSFVDGARVFVLPGSHVRVGSIFVYLGEVLVKVKGLFEVQTNYATAGSEGTEYQVRVDPGERVRVVVADDHVLLASRYQYWRKVVLASGQSAWIVGAEAPRVGADAVSPAEIEGIRQRIRVLDALVPQPADLRPVAAAGVVFGLGWLLNKEMHRDSRQDSHQDSHRDSVDRAPPDSYRRPSSPPVQPDSSPSPPLRLPPLQ